MNDLRERFARFVQTRQLVAQGETVLVALSGGIDSVVLLHLFKSTAASFDADLRAAHFDHAMRPDSAADAAWVASLCTAWGIPLISARASRPIHGELDARNERYRFLQSALQSSGATRAATAHHADDQIETVLFRLLRGTGMRGLAGIPVRRGPFIRPLLRFRKADLVAYADANSLDHRHDASNDELTYTRNRIRKIVIPAIETVQPNAGSSVLHLARYAARTESLWRSAIEQLEQSLILQEDARTTELARAILLEYHPELRARVLRHVLRKHGIVPGRAHTRELLEFCENAKSGAALRVGDRVTIERAFDRLRIVRSAQRDAPEASVRLENETGAARLRVAGCSYDVEWSIGHDRSSSGERFDAAVLAQQPEMRGWLPGDRITLPYGTKKLKKLFAERRIPASDRGRVPILADNQGRVLWAAGVARSVHALPSDTGPALNITVRNAESR